MADCEGEPLRGNSVHDMAPEDMIDRPAADFSVTHPLRPVPLAGGLTLVAFTCAAFAAGWLARPFVPVATHQLWSAATLAFLLVWLAIEVAIVVRRPSAQEAVRLWSRAAQFIILASQGIVIWAAWAFLPHCPASERAMLAGMFLVCSPAQIIASPENVTANRIALVGSYGSVALWFLVFGGATDWPIALFAAGCGTMFFLLADVIPKTVDNTVAGRLASDEAVARLEAALADVAEERDAKTRFIAAASHDLGQPLQAASLYFDQSLRAPEGQARSRAVDGVRQAFASAEQLLAHMLNHLRLEADAVDPQFAPVPVGRLLARIALQYAPAAERAGMAIRYVSSSAVIHSDRVLIERALGNLVVNAIDHSGGTQILLGLRRGQGQAEQLWVIDNGGGVPEQEQQALFTDYFQGERSLRQRRGGFGLGLASVRRIARLLGGDARLEPRWRKGAAFCLELAPGALSNASAQGLSA